MIDFTQTSAFENVPPDTYNASLTGFEFVPQTRSGKPGVKLTYTITEGEFKGRKVSETKSLQPQAIWSTKAHLIALGASSEQLSGHLSVDDFTQLGNELLGNECRIVTGMRNGTNRDGEEREYSQIDQVLSAL